jgi:hypothetical protein
MVGRDQSLSNPQKILPLKRMKTRRSRRNRRNRKRSYRNARPSQRGGLGQAYSIPEYAVVSAGFQEPDNTYPVLMEYGGYREALDNPIFGGNDQGVKLNRSNVSLTSNKNAESSGRKEVQVQQALAGVEGNSSSRRRRSANRSYS